jgi:chemotaxis protein histidine kinase CheA
MSNSPSNGGNAAIIQPPNALRSRLGGRLPNIDPSAIAKAEAALKGLSAQFGEWLRDEVAKLDAAHTALKAEGPTQACADAVYSRAHDLKGLGTTYGFPLVTRIAGSLCRLLGEKDDRTQAPVALVSAHVDAVKACVRDNVRDTDNPVGRALVEQLEQHVSAFLGG